jgi:putative thioredoxin
MADVTDATFEADVLERSMQVPIVVDLWAPWCGPCRTLGPTLEKVIGATEGKVELAKVNVDENPGISQAFRVQSIPAVYALHKKQVVNGFVGALPEHEVQAFVDSLLGPPSEIDQLLDAGDEASLRKVLELEPGNQEAIIRLSQQLIDSGAGEEALGLLARIPETPEVRHLMALARVAGDGEPVIPDDGMTEKLDALLNRVKDDDDARQEYVDLLEVMGPDDPRTADYRKKLTSRLF